MSVSISYLHLTHLLSSKRSIDQSIDLNQPTLYRTLIELAILPLPHSLTKEAPTPLTSLMEKFQTAKAVLGKSSVHSYCFRQIGDSSIVYILRSIGFNSSAWSFLALGMKTSLQVRGLLKNSSKPYRLVKGMCF